MLGRAWREALDELSIDCDAPARSELDLTDTNAIVRHVTDRYRAVVNCAAWTDVDGAESDQAGANALNGRAVGALAEQCARAGALLVHYSTDYVFNGHTERPYAVDDEVAPINAYGRSKALGERLLREAAPPHLLVRTSWLYAPWGRNFVRTIAGLARERESLDVVDDQTGRPTCCRGLVRSTIGLLRHGAGGTFHVTDGGTCTWFAFAQRIAAQVNPRCRVNPCRTDPSSRPAARPACSVIDLSKTEAIIGACRRWEENLMEVIEQMER